MKGEILKIYSTKPWRLKSRNHPNKVRLRGLTEKQGFLTHVGGSPLDGSVTSSAGTQDMNRNYAKIAKNLDLSYRPTGSQFLMGETPKTGLVHQAAKNAKKM